MYDLVLHFVVIYVWLNFEGEILKFKANSLHSFGCKQNCTGPLEKEEFSYFALVSYYQAASYTWKLNRRPHGNQLSFCLMRFWSLISYFCLTWGSELIWSTFNFSSCCVFLEHDLRCHLSTFYPQWLPLAPAHATILSLTPFQWVVLRFECDSIEFNTLLEDTDIPH